MPRARPRTLSSSSTVHGDIARRIESIREVDKSLRFMTHRSDFQSIDVTGSLKQRPHYDATIPQQHSSCWLVLLSCLVRDRWPDGEVMEEQIMAVGQEAYCYNPGHRPLSIFK
uniref:(northern house mosquito) hypothetical protein n=1 Tax=Culex pipiens TaxID=7175 RepID=A0A8D8ILF2_CULPI